MVTLFIYSNPPPKDWARPPLLRTEPDWASLKIFSVRIYAVRGFTSNVMWRLNLTENPFFNGLKCRRTNIVEWLKCWIYITCQASEQPHIILMMFCFSTVHLLSMVTPWNLNFRNYDAGKWCRKMWYICEKDTGMWKFYVWVWATKQISTEISHCLSYGSILAQSLFVLWLNPGSILIFSVAQSWINPYFSHGPILALSLSSHGSILAQSLFVLWLIPGQDWAIGKIRTEPGFEPQDK